MAVIFEGFVFPPGGAGEVVHRLLDAVVDRVVPRVCRLAGLEVGVRVGGRAANDRVLRVQGAGAMGVNFRLRKQVSDRVISQRDDFVDFVRGTETVEEMNKRHAAFQRRNVRDQREVLRFLNAAGAQHRAAGLAYGHDVRVVAEDGQRVSGNGTCRNVKHKRRELPGQLVQRWDHQQQPLR